MSIIPLVSVVMTTYNRADVLGSAVDSILNQTYDNFELVIVDDGCTDGTSQILKKYIAKDKRIFLLKQNNQGLAAARNAGVKKAQGKYIAFMDDDDISAPNRLEKQIAFLEKYPDYSACICGIQFINLNGEFIINNNANVFYEEEHYPLIQDPYKSKQLNEYGLGTWTCLTKKSFINCNGYRIADHLIIEDLDFTLRFLRKYKGACISGESLYLYTAPEETFGNNLSTKDCINFLKRHIACYISDCFRRYNITDPVEENLKLEEIISLITKLSKSDRYLIYKSVCYMVPRIMAAKKISRRKAKIYISMITRVNQAKHPIGYFWLRLNNPGLIHL